MSLHIFLVAFAALTGVGLLLLASGFVDLPSDGALFPNLHEEETEAGSVDGTVESKAPSGGVKSCATVEEMGESFKGEGVWEESLKVRRIIQRHFALNGASKVRDLPPEEFCRHGFVLGKASEAGFGNEMYKILNAAALSIMLNRSLIVGQTRDKYPFGDYITYSSESFTLKEIKHLWRKHDCIDRYKRNLVMRIDDFGKPAKTNVLCSNWRKWKEPIIWFQNATDAMASQFFLKSVHPEMRNAAANLFGKPELLESQPNVFGELMKVIISPSEAVEEAVNWVLGGGPEPDITLHMRMLMNRPVRAVRAALNCVREAMNNLPQMRRSRVVLVSDTPSFVKSTLANISEFAEVLHFDYKRFQGNISGNSKSPQNLDFRVKDWGPAPRWVAFVDFFLASRAKHAVVSGAHRRVGTTYAQLIAALAGANSLGENVNGSSFSFLSSFQSNLLTDGLRLQIGWGHVWNRFAGPLSCPSQPNQCAHTPLLPPAWWDGLWQSPIPRDVRRLELFGVKLSGFGTVDENHLQSFCNSRKNTGKTVTIIQR